MVFFTYVLKITNHFIHFSLRNSELSVKKNVFSKKKICIFFIGENKEWIKNVLRKEMYVA